VLDPNAIRFGLLRRGPPRDILNAARDGWQLPFSTIGKLRFQRISSAIEPAANSSP
jgi:hypothetical protein